VNDLHDTLIAFQMDLQIPVKLSDIHPISKVS